MNRRNLFWFSAILLGAGYLLHLFVFDAWLVPRADPAFTASVLPTLYGGDRVLVRRGQRPASGQLARCASPIPGGTWVVGRAFGSPGTTIDLRDDHVTVSGALVKTRSSCPAVTVVHPQTTQSMLLACQVEGDGFDTYSILRGTETPDYVAPVIIPAGKVFLVSDDRQLHQDSRDFGLLEESTCERIVFRLWGDTWQDVSRRLSFL